MSTGSPVPVPAPAPTLADLLALSTPGNLVVRLTRQRSIYAARGLRWLCAPPGAVQSALCVARPAAPVLPNHRAMTLAAALPERVCHVLDLGSGCGAMLAFARSLPDLVTLTGVEADAAMLLVAREYFALSPEQPVVVEDAMSFLGRGEGRFDLVFCDVFDGLAEPAWLASAGLYRRLACRLGDDGAVAINMLPRTAEQLRPRLEHARAHFPGLALYAVPGQGNVVVLLSKRPLPPAARWRAQLLALNGDQRRIETGLIDTLVVLP